MYAIYKGEICFAMGNKKVRDVIKYLKWLKKIRNSLIL